MGKAKNLAMSEEEVDKLILEYVNIRKTIDYRKDDKIMGKAKNLVMSEEEVDEMILEYVNEAIDDSIREIIDVEGLSTEQVMEDYRFNIKRALFIARNQL